MKNKKIIVALLVVVMVLSMVAVCLTACNKDDEWIEVEASVLAARMDAAIENLAPSDALLNNTEIAADLNVKTTYGDSTKEYNIAFAVKLGLDKTDDNTNAFSLVITDASDNSTVFGAYYDESLDSPYNDKVYLQGPEKNLALQAVKVKDVIKEQDADISDSWCEDAQNTVLDALSEYFVGYVIETAGGLGTVKMSKDNTIGRLELPLTTLLKDTSSEGLGGVLNSIGSGMIDPILEQLGIDLQVANLVNVLPELSVALQFTFEGTGSDTVLKNIQAELTCGEKDLKINKTNGGTLLEIDIANDFSAVISGDIYVAPETSKVVWAPSAVYNAEVINALNFTLTGELTVENDITATFSPLNVNIPAGEYDVTIALDADPTALIGKSFNSSSLSETLTIIGDVLNDAVDYMLLDIKSKTASESDSSLLKLELTKDAGGNLRVTASELGALGLNVDITGTNISNAISTIANLFTSGDDSATTDPEEPSTEEPSGDVSGSTSGSTSGDATDTILASIQPYIQILSIIIKGGEASVNLDGATFDIKDETTGEVTSTATLNAGITVNSEGITITGQALGLDKLAPNGTSLGLPADISLTIKVTSFKIGNAGN